MWYLSHSILARASDLKLAVSKGRETLSSSPGVFILSSIQFWSVIPRGSWVYPGPSSVHAFAVFIYGVLFGFLHFRVLVALAMTGSGNKALLRQLTLDVSSSGAYVPKTADTVLLDIAVMCRVIAGT